MLFILEVKTHHQGHKRLTFAQACIEFAMTISDSDESQKADEETATL